jgi:phosphatidylserine/phosphatidylglycerophosphate/cardiolipin synthase-like enzyme
VAAYNLNLWSIRNALLDAWRRGVQVRMVVESDNLDGDEIQDLVAVGIPVLGDRREGLMHNKFVIIDRQEVWTGSLNFTVSGGYYDNNNLVRIRSTQVAETYLHEFDEMFMDDRFGPDSVADTLHPFLTIDGVEVEFYFSPDDGVAARLVELISEAQESIYFMAFSFTADDIGAAIVDAALTRNVTVAGVMEAEQVKSNQGTEYDFFLQSGLDVLLDGNEDQMHHKVIIIDRSIVITGSYNFSASAETRNDENLVIIHNPVIAGYYLDEFQRVNEQVQP